MLGRNICSSILEYGKYELIASSRSELDLFDQRKVEEFLGSIRPDVVIHAAAKVGGIKANIEAPYEFISQNLILDSNLIASSLKNGVESFLYIGSSCMYPKNYRQPLVEEDILAAPLETTNEGYALAKIAGSRQCQYISEQFGLNYRTLIPSNLYGPGDNFSELSSHLLAAAISKVAKAKSNHSNSVKVWGDGTACREFTFVCDLSTWITQNIENIQSLPNYLNLGSGNNLTVLDYYKAVCKALDYDPELTFDLTKPSGMTSKLMDSSKARLNFGWNPDTDLVAGIVTTHNWMVAQKTNERS